MSKKLEQSHPLLMVPHVFTVGVVIYTNGEQLHFPTDAVRQAIAQSLPPGTGVGSISCTGHGIYDGKQGAA